MIHIHSVDKDPLLSIPCVVAAPGGRGGPLHVTLEVLVARVEGLPEELSGLVVTGDLQAYDRADVPVGDRRLMGSVLIEELEVMATCGMMPDLKELGVVLVGDLYAIPTLDKRGGLGDVEDVWFDAASRFRWVVGVAGNHDTFRGVAAFGDTFASWPTIHALHGDVVEVDGLRVGGVSGVLGKKGKAWRNTHQETRALLRGVVAKRPDLIVLHEGPDVPLRSKLRGKRVIRDILEANHFRGMVMNGHCHWPTPVAQMSPHTQVLNVDGRAVLLIPHGR